MTVIREMKLSERINTPISTSELERRWAAVREGMEERGIDVLLIQSPHEMAGGYVRWFTDIAVTDQPVTVLFAPDDAMTVVMHGPFGGDQEIPLTGHETLRGVRRIVTTPMFPAASFTGAYVAEALVGVLAPYGNATIGVLGEHLFSFATLDRVRRHFPEATFVDACDFVDRLKSVKSDEEKELIRRAAGVQDAVLEAAIAAIAPGKRDSDITAVARRAAQELGSESGILLCGSAPAGSPAMFGNLHMQHRVIERGDVISLLVEVNGPGGYYAEVGRTCVLGRASPELLTEFEFALETQRRTVEQLRPGAVCGDIWDSHNMWMREHGLPEEGRIHCHGQGYDFVERPLVRVDEPMRIEADMNFTCHPGYVRGGVWSWVCDNYLVREDGPPEPLHRFPQKIVEI